MKYNISALEHPSHFEKPKAAQKADPIESYDFTCRMKRDHRLISGGGKTSRFINKCW